MQLIGGGDNGGATDPDFVPDRRPSPKRSVPRPAPARRPSKPPAAAPAVSPPRRESNTAVRANVVKALAGVFVTSKDCDDQLSASLADCLYSALPNAPPDRWLIPSGHRFSRLH